MTEKTHTYELDLALELTGPQVEALRVAHEMGRYSNPATSTIEEVAEELGLSYGGAGSRLRRARHAVLKQVVAALDDPRPNSPAGLDELARRAGERAGGALVERQRQAGPRIDDSRGRE